MTSLSCFCFILVGLTMPSNVTTSWFSRSTIPTLPDGMDHIVAACQEDNLMLQCQNRYSKVVIQDVFYGRDNLFTCTSKLFNATKLCSVPTPKSIVEKVNLMCNNENKCKVPVTTTFLQSNDEEICFGIRKYLKVKYACHQHPRLHMVCADGCSSSCWPLCQLSCCHSPSPPLTINISQPLLVHQQEIVIHPEQQQQCGGGCPTQCAPLCQPTCCTTQIPTFQIPSLSSLSTCPGSTCSSSCLPLCDPTCCLLHKTKNTQQFNQPPPLQQVPPPPSCPGQCASQCAPLCSPSCCLSQSTVPACPGTCSSQCAPSCQPSCCQSAPTMMMAPPPPPPQCPTGCPTSCAPLCQPTCCQTSMPSSMMMVPQPHPLPPPSSMCPVGCPGSCLPMCQPICCGQGNMMPPPVQMPQMMPQMMPQIMPMAAKPMGMMGGCPPMCGGSMCTPSCPPRCCVSTRGQVANPRKFDPRELQQRRTYQQMLTHFRRKQLQRYFYGRK